MQEPVNERVLVQLRSDALLFFDNLVNMNYEIYLKGTFFFLNLGY